MDDIEIAIEALVEVQRQHPILRYTTGGCNCPTCNLTIIDHQDGCATRRQVDIALRYLRDKARAEFR